MALRANLFATLSDEPSEPAPALSGPAPELSGPAPERALERVYSKQQLLELYLAGRVATMHLSVAEVRTLRLSPRDAAGQPRRMRATGMRATGTSV